MKIEGLDSKGNHLLFQNHFLHFLKIDYINFKTFLIYLTNVLENYLIFFL
jgi:hypothetical protein